MAGSRGWATARGEVLVPGWTAVGLLGGGARTEAWLCADDDRLGVVKVLRPDRRTPDDVARLRAEVAAYRDADHPTFPALLEVALDDDPAWFALEHVDGPSLDEAVEEHGPLDLEQALPLLRTLAAALAHLHGRGRVHLDVKPSNVVLATTPRLLDLGASRSVRAAAGLGPGVGTWHSLAPEQSDPATFGLVGPASDVWGIGITLLYAVTGAAPLRARRDAEPPGEAALADAARGVVQDAPRQLQDVLRACLATDASQRPAAAALLEDAAAVSPPGGLIARLGRMVRGQADDGT